MVRTKTSSPSTSDAIDINAVYEIVVERPFSHNSIQFLPGKDRTYTVKGGILNAIKDKVADFRRVG